MTQVGDYTLERELARGGTASVHLARAPDGREVALKLLTGLDPRARERFAREAEAWRRLAHPGIVRVLDAGEEQGRPFLVLELCRGGSLEDRLRRGPLAPREAVGLAAQVARALEHAHQAGLLHRDLKPANVLLDGRGQAKLSDFGLVRDLTADERTRLSRTGAFLGTPGYWPPEQALGQLERLGPASDVYALGATLHALLTGEPPFVGDTLLEVLRATELEAPRPPSTSNPAVDPALDAIVLRCLAKAPQDRYPSAGALGADLEAWSRGRARSGGPPRLALGLVGGATLVALAVLAGGAAFRGESAGDAAAAPSRASGAGGAPAPTEPTPEVDPEPVPALLAEAEVLWGEGRYEESLRRVTEAARLAPHSPRVRLRQARSLIGQGAAGEALALIEEQLRLSPRDASFLTLRANLRMRAGEDAAALADLEAALASDPDHEGASKGLAVVLDRLGRLEEALVVSERGMARFGRTPVLLLVHAQSLLRLGRAAEARDELDLCLRELEIPQAYAARAEARFVLQDYLGALSDASAAVGLGHPPGALRAVIGSSLVELRRYPDALAIFDSEQIGPNEPILGVQRCLCLAELGRDLARAEAELLGWVAAYPELTAALLALARVRRLRGDLRGAWQVLERPGLESTCAARLERARLSLDAGDLVEAAAEVERARSLNPEHVELLRLEAELAAHRGYLAEARALLERLQARERARGVPEPDLERWLAPLLRRLGG